MTALKIPVPQIAPLPNFELPKPYCDDKWHVPTWNYYLSAPLSQQDYWNRCGHTEKPYIDFTICENEYIREEIKYFLYLCIEVNKVALINFSSYESRLRHLIRLVNEKYMHIYSINEVEEEDYIHYLKNNKIISDVYEKSGTRINKDMEKVDALKKNRTILLLGHLKKVVTEFYERAEPVWDKDVWDYRKIAFIDQEKNSNKRNLNFKGIKQPAMKQQLKNFCQNRIQYNTVSAVSSVLGHVKAFTEWLRKEYPKAKYFDQVNRDMLEDFFCWLRVESGKSTSYISTCILDLKNFFEIGILLEFDHFPETCLISSSDYRTKKPINPEFYSDEEIKRIREVFKKLPIIYGKIVVCLIITALRSEDLLTLTPDRIELKGDIPTIRIYQGKTKNPVNICIPIGIYDLLQDQIRYNKETFGEDTKYIFATSVKKHISYSAVMTAINTAFYENDVLGDDGNILRFKTHKFRKTKATKLISYGFGASTASDALGHSGLRSLSSYANVNNKALIDSLEPYLKKVDILVNNIGKAQPLSENEIKNALPLCNGWCCRPISMGLCEHANYCLSCSMFKPDSRHLNTYCLQLEELKTSLEMAKQSDNPKLVTKLEKDILKLERIIETVNDLCQKET